jgi:hypothetical protein
MTRAITISLCCVIACATSAFVQEPGPRNHYPLEVGHRWTYRMTDLKAPPGQPVQKRQVVIEVERTEVYVDKKKDKGVETTTKYKGFILKMTSGNKSTEDLVVVLPSGIHRVHIGKTPITPPMLFFKAAEQWPLDSVSGNKNLKGTFTAKADKVTVLPFSKEPLAAWLVSFNNNEQGEERSEVDCWYVPDVGMVKQRIKGQGQEVILELEKFEKAK